MKHLSIGAAMGALLLAGCVSSGVQVKEEQLSSFEAGKTTLPQVVAALGQPTNTTVLSDGSRMLGYSYVQAQARPASFIPFIGPMVGGADAKTNTVTLSFDRGGVLKSYTSTASESGVGTGFAADAGRDPVENQPRQVQ